MQSIDVEDASFDIGARSALGDDVKFTLGKVTAKTPAGTIGPWAIFVEQDVNARRTRIVFDPAVPDGPTALIVKTSAAEEVTVKVPRTSLAHLGIPPTLLGVTGDGPDVEATLEGKLLANGRAELGGTMAAFGIFQANKKTYDLKLKGGVAGDVKKPLPFVKTTAQLGPFFTDVTGTVTLKDEIGRAHV